MHEESISTSLPVVHSESTDLLDPSSKNIEQVQILGLDKTREDFCGMLASCATQDANQLVVARLMHEVTEM